MKHMKYLEEQFAEDGLDGNSSKAAERFSKTSIHKLDAKLAA
jgi:hypothetical protein